MAVLLPCLLWLLTALAAVARQGRLLEAGYPVLAIGIGLYLVRRYPAHYVGFLCWMTFLTPEVRRLADFFNGAFNPNSPIQVAPVAVAALSALTLTAHYRRLAQRQGLPFLLILLGIVYAYPVGIIRNSPLGATWAFIQWIYPVMIAFHITVTHTYWRDYRRIVTLCFEWGTLVMGLYALIQFFFIPPWDAFWLVASHLQTEGLPVAFGMRVSSTMNSSGPFAITMVMGLLLLTARFRTIGVVSGVAGTLALLLTAVRAAWGGWFIGVAYLMLNLNAGMRLRIAASVMTLALLAIPIGMTAPVAKVISARFDTLSSLSSDSSFNARAAFYISFLSTAFSEIGGTGLGVSGDATRLNSARQASQQFGSFDSGLMEIPYTLGWPSTVLFFGGVIWLMARALHAARRMRQDRMVCALVSTALALGSMLIFLNTLNGPIGLFFYMSTALPIVLARKQATP